ncbi:MAG: hypothetical protein BRD26_06120 [Bacteroidetes bacterium QH_1_64_81]|nr:MAG: hypothetical protein BRD26_06120 [Bacteroidetes bacterium QH_1_64_81]
MLLLAALGFVGAAGLHRLYLKEFALGLVYLFTAGLCLIGTIYDVIKYKDLALRCNRDVALEVTETVRQVYDNKSESGDAWGLTSVGWNVRGCPLKEDGRRRTADRGRRAATSTNDSQCRSAPRGPAVQPSSLQRTSRGSVGADPDGCGCRRGRSKPGVAGW